MRTAWNEEEDEALQGLPLRAQIIYLRGIRRYMDYTSRISGGPQRRISLTMLAETAQEVVNRQIKPKATKESIRASLEQLIRAGLLNRLLEPDYLVFFLPKADEAKSVQNNNPTTTHQPPTSGHSIAEPLPVAAYAVDNPPTAPAPPSPNNPTHQESGFQENYTLPNGRVVHPPANQDRATNPNQTVELDQTAVPERVTANQHPSPPPYAGIVDLYHECLPLLPAVYKLNDGRRQRIKALWSDELEDLSSWRNYFKHIARSDFLMGRTPGRNGAPFMASFDFIIHPAKFIKIAEEQYHGKKIQRQPG